MQLLNNLPEVTFVETDANTILADMVAGYEQAYFESTGQRKKLYPGDPIRIFLYTQAMREIQLRHAIDDAAKQNLLYYARDSNLDHLGAFQTVERLDEEYAKVTMKFKLSAPRPSPVIIPAGTRVSPDDALYFEVLERQLIEPGQIEIDVVTECLDPGEIGNGFTPGQINILVDPIPWVESVVNVEESKGGAELEDDESYKERIHLSPESYSVAGPEGAYEYFTKSYSSLITDVKVINPLPGHVDVRLILAGGELPNAAFLEGVLNDLNAKHRRPLTDYVQVNAPDVDVYNINVQYYIGKENGAHETAVRGLVEKAIQDYVIWQKSKIGRDRNPSELISRMVQAGAKRVNVIEPTFATLNDHQVAIEGTINIEYGGIEDE